jgi:hypothetical protein
MTDITQPPAFSLNDIVSRLTIVYGADESRRLVAELLAEAGLNDIGSADDLLSLSERFIARRSFLEVIGRSLKANAILRGATLPDH